VIRHRDLYIYLARVRHSRINVTGIIARLLEGVTIIRQR
jgi:hypothetical protein